MQVLQLNVGNVDRLLRVLLGVVLIGLALFDAIGPWGYLGVIPLVSGAMAFCPLYSMFRFSTTAR
jgi:hypothetical protein